MVGAYHIVSLIGAGGMGEVFRARDTRLGRDVAIKVLPAALEMDRERLARFEQEARLLAALNHPNIAHIYGLETSPVPFIVMELVDGVTLADKLAKIGALPIDDALPIARQIADALDAAHERGIVHRDLKPANIAIASDGTVKVLDLGLAKADAGSGSSEPGLLTHSPTMLRPTVGGVLLGTAPYMSPEQARGKPVDKRADIWAFGCVLYEMLSGRRAFDGETTTDALARIVEREPAWDALPPTTPAAIVRLLKRTLEKDVKRRLRDIGDARVELDVVETAPVGAAAAAPAKALFAAVVLIGLVTGAAATWLALRSSPREPRPSMRLTFAAPEGSELELGSPVPSPDGSRIAFIARDRDGQQTVWIRPLGSLSAQKLAGTEGVGNVVFWSPDGAWIGFSAAGKLKRIAASGGPVLNISTINNLLGATWAPDNTIVLAPSNRTVLHRVPAAGGTPEPLTTLNAERHENSHRWPQFLPDGRRFVFTARSDQLANNLIYVGSLDSKEVKPLVAAQSSSVYVSPGILLYVRERTLMAQRVDPSSLSLLDDPVVVAADVAHSTASSRAFFGASSDGAVISYEPPTPERSTLTWYNRAGQALGAVGPERPYVDVQLSPDGRLAAVVIIDEDSGNRDIWLLTLANGTMSRFTTNPANDWQMTWSPDGRRIAFASDRNGRSSVYVKAIDGVDEELLVQIPERGVFPKSWSNDGKVMTLGVDTPGGLPKLWAMPLDGARKPFPLGSDEGPTRENEIQLSANGRWIVFESNQTGVNEIFLAPFPNGRRRQLSSGGGINPRWGPRDREVYYVAPNGSIMVVGFDGAEMEPTAPKPLLQTCPLATPPASAGTHQYDVTRDGARFLVRCIAAGSNPTQIVVAADALSAINKR